MGGLAKREWVAKTRTYGDLLQEYNSNPENFCDALARCLKAIRDNKELLQKIKELLY